MRTVFAFCSILALSGCAIIIAPDGHDARFETAWSSGVKGNGDIKTEQRPVSAISQLSISGAMQVEVRVGEAPSMSVTADSNLLNLVQTQVIDGTQKIWVDERWNSQNPIRVVLTTPSLKEVSSSGSGRLNIQGLNGGEMSLKNTGSRSVILEGQLQRLEIHSTGSGRINANALLSQEARVRVTGSGSTELGRVNGRELNVSLHGSGSVNAAGQVEKLVAQTYGSGSLELSSVRSQIAELSVYGSGDLHAAVMRSVVAQAQGSGRMTIYGSPAQRDVSGKRVSFVN